jgi:hypothetical protein
MSNTKPRPLKDPLPLRRHKPATKPTPLRVVRTALLTADDQAVLDRLSKDLSDVTGRTVGGSAVIRALLRFAGLQQYNWVLTTLAPLVEQEQVSGTVWGKHKESS